MERQRSFSMKRTRLLLFSLFTISCSLLFFSLVSSFTTHLQFIHGLYSIKVQNFAAFSTGGYFFAGGAKNPSLVDAHDDFSKKGEILGGLGSVSLRKIANFSKENSDFSRGGLASSVASGNGSLKDGFDGEIREIYPSGGAMGSVAVRKMANLADAGAEKNSDLSQKFDSESLIVEFNREIRKIDPSGGEMGSVSVRKITRLADFTAEKSPDLSHSFGSGSLSDGSNGEIKEIDPSGGAMRSVAVKKMRNVAHSSAEKSSDLSHRFGNGSFSDASEKADDEIGAVVGGTCDISVGKWVFDERYPMYNNYTCPFIDEGFSCETNGRLDRNYMKWRWEPKACNIPRFDPVRMLELIRGKRLVFVGDSINRNQWESMLCMLRGAVTDPHRVFEARGRRITKERGNYNFKFVDYQCSVEFYVSHFLVREGKARIRQKRSKILRIDSIDRSSSRWRGADILVFNTAHWWSHYKTKAGVNYYQEGDRVHPHLDVSTGFQKALKTWALWVDQHVNPAKTRVFFRSSSPSHFSGGEWNSGGHCKESTKPLNDTVTRPKPEKNIIVERVVRQMRTPVTVLDITNLSGLRIDGHPSVYGIRPGKEIGIAMNIQDCSHWCLPGVPDTWNELLYFHLLAQQKPVFTAK